MKPGLNIVSIWFGLIMVLFTFCGALALAFTDVMDDRLFGNKRVIFIVLLLAYSAYRGYRTYHAFKQMRNADRD